MAKMKYKDIKETDIEKIKTKERLRVKHAVIMEVLHKVIKKHMPHYRGEWADIWDEIVDVGRKHYIEKL